jgi:hypothetical protein
LAYLTAFLDRLVGGVLVVQWLDNGICKPMLAKGWSSTQMGAALKDLKKVFNSPASFGRTSEAILTFVSTPYPPHPGFLWSITTFNAPQKEFALQSGPSALELTKVNFYMAKATLDYTIKTRVQTLVIIARLQEEVNRIYVCPPSHAFEIRFIDL